MPVPTYDQFIEPLLRFLAAQPDGVIAKLAHDEAADSLGLTDVDKQVLLPSGAQAIYKNRAGWAHDRLKRAGLSSSPRRGFWKITPDGGAFVQANPAPFPAELAEKLATGYISVNLKPAALTVVGLPSAPQAFVPQASPIASPDDRLGQALEELRQAAECQLLELLANLSPAFFETIVLDLLHRMGYGASTADPHRLPLALSRLTGDTRLPPGDAGLRVLQQPEQALRCSA